MPFRLVIWEPDGWTDQTHRIATGSHAQFSYSLLSGERSTLNVTMEVRAGDSYVPTIGSQLRYYESQGDTEECVYAGTIDNYKDIWFSNEGDHYTALSLVTLESLFDTVTVSARVYTGKTAGYIFLDLVSKILEGAPLVIALGTVSGAEAVTIPSLPFDGSSSVRDGLDRLVTEMVNVSGTNWAWGVDPRPAIPEVYFRPPQSVANTITGAKGDILWESLELDRNRSDFRNRQAVVISPDAFTPSGFCFISPTPPTNIFTLPFIPSQIISARITRTAAGTVATALGQMFALPYPGQTVKLGNITYSFVAELDNKVQWQVLIADTTLQTTQNFMDAINANPLTAGVAFSLPTWENDQANAVVVEDDVAFFYAQAKRAGSAGNLIEIASDGVGFTWVVFTLDPFPGMPSASFLAGGTDPPPGFSDVALNIVNSTPDADSLTQPTLLNIPGQPDITVLLPQRDPVTEVTTFVENPVAVFWILEVIYRRIGSNIIAVEDSALVADRAEVEHSTGWYQRAISAMGIKDAAAGLQLALKALAQYATLPYTLKFSTWKNFLHVGDALNFTIEVPSGAAAILNDSPWTIQEVQGSYIAALDTVGNYSVKHTVTAIRGSLITKTVTWLAFWRGLAQIGKQRPPDKPAIPAPLPECLTFSIANATVAEDVAEHHPLPQSYLPLQVTVVPKIVPVLDLTGVILSDGVEFFPFTIPADTPADTKVIVDPATWTAPPPAILAVGKIQTVNITGGDGASDYRGVFTIRIDVLPTSITS